MTIWRMRIACWIPTATNTHSVYVILINNCIAEKPADDNMAHGHCMLDTYGYKHTQSVRNIYFFCTATIIAL